MHVEKKKTSWQQLDDIIRDHHHTHLSLAGKAGKPACPHNNVPNNTLTMKHAMHAISQNTRLHSR